MVSDKGYRIQEHTGNPAHPSVDTSCWQYDHCVYANPHQSSLERQYARSDANKEIGLPTTDTMMRVGAIHSLDVDDFDPEEKSLEVVYRPETDTPIKNSTDGERFIALSDEVCQLLIDWIDQRRPASVDKHGREPLITTSQGRAHTTTLRGDCYRYTQPCIRSGECPHGRDIDDCPATDYERASECPLSESPHALRRGGITNSLQQDWPMKAVGDRANVSEQVLEMHYNQRTEKEKMEQRRDYLDRL